MKQRLIDAYTKHLDGFDHAEVPAGLRHGFAELHAALTRVAPAGRESRVRASVQKMSPVEASHHAAVIVELYVGALSHVERAEPLKVVAAPKKAPRYLTNRS